jgi:RNA polymerase sigma-70 factor (ECF subfamily)
VSSVTSANPIDDDQLLRRAVQDRDPAALAELLVGAHDRLLVYIRRRLPLDLERHVDPEDILHDTFATAFQEISTLRSTSRAAFHAWLTTVAQNRLRNVAKAQRALKRGGGRDALSLPHTGALTNGDDDDNGAMAADLLEMLARTSRSPRSVAGNHEYIAMMRQAIEELEPEHRVVLRLRFIEDLPHAQIAEQTGRTEAAVRQLCLRALRRLRGLLPAISLHD